MSEFYIELPDGTPAVVTGLPEPSHTDQIVTSTQEHQSEPYDGNPEVGYDSPEVIIGGVVVASFVVLAAYHRHRQKYPPQR